MTSVRIATLNVKKGELDWERRARWMLRQLADLDADAIGLQEVDLRIDQGNWICDRLNELMADRPGAGEYRVHHMANPRDRVTLEALAILTRLPILEHDGYDYLFRNRVAHRARLDTGRVAFDLWNTHFHHEVGAEHNAVRVRQAEQLAGWIAQRSNDVPHVLVGDLNAIPGTKPLRILSGALQPAYDLVHRQPPRSTVSPMGERSADLPGDLTLDYLLASKDVEIMDAALVLTDEDPNQPGVWASDHVGLMADLELR